MPDRVIGRVRRRISYFVNETPESHTKAQQLLTEAFGKTLTQELQVPIDAINSEELKKWIIGFNKLFVKKVDDKVIIITPSESDMAVFGSLLGKMICQAILGDEKEQQKQVEAEIKEVKTEEKKLDTESDDKLPNERVSSFMT